MKLKKQFYEYGNYEVALNHDNMITVKISNESFVLNGKYITKDAALRDAKFTLQNKFKYDEGNCLHFELLKKVYEYKGYNIKIYPFECGVGYKVTKDNNFIHQSDIFGYEVTFEESKKEAKKYIDDILSNKDTINIEGDFYPRDDFKEFVKQFLDKQEDKKKYPPDLAYQIGEMEEVIEKIENKNISKWKVRKRICELLLEIAKQFNEE